MFFFFKQKTAYEMRMSDWSSDVCSSDLGDQRGGDRLLAEEPLLDELDRVRHRVRLALVDSELVDQPQDLARVGDRRLADPGRQLHANQPRARKASRDRKRGVEGKSG